MGPTSSQYAIHDTKQSLWTEPSKIPYCQVWLILRLYLIQMCPVVVVVVACFYVGPVRGIDYEATRCIHVLAHPSPREEPRYHDQDHL